MRALVYLGPGRMELQDAPDPTPGPDEVVIASRASAICGSDLHGFREASPRRIPPLIMGHETVGEIAGVGDGVPDGRIGERVVLKPIVSCGECAWWFSTMPLADGQRAFQELVGGAGHFKVVLEF